MATVPPRAIIAAYEAAKATDGIKRYKLGAVLFDKKGRIYNAKGNSRKTHPLALRYSLYPYLHAESHCIISHGLDNCAGLSLYVCRCDSFGNLTMARPCDSCALLIDYAKIKKVYYTDWKGEIGCLDF